MARVDDLQIQCCPGAVEVVCNHDAGGRVLQVMPFAQHSLQERDGLSGVVCALVVVGFRRAAQCRGCDVLVLFDIAAHLIAQARQFLG